MLARAYAGLGDADQDTAGPMAKSVADVAILLGVLQSANPNPNDPASTQKMRPAAPVPVLDANKKVRSLP